MTKSGMPATQKKFEGRQISLFIASFRELSHSESKNENEKKQVDVEMDPPIL